MNKCLAAAVLFCAFGGARAQFGSPLAAPGLPLPSSSLPQALDHYQGKPQLVPIHHSNVEVNAHTGANVAGSLAGSFFYKPKTTIELAGEHARTILHDATPSIFIHTLEDPDGADPANAAAFSIVRAVADKNKRVFTEIRHTQLTGNSKRKAGEIETKTEVLGNGWLKVTPTAPLPPGEYGFLPLPKNQNTFSTVIFDFAITPDAPNAADAVMQNPASEN